MTHNSGSTGDSGDTGSAEAATAATAAKAALRSHIRAGRQRRAGADRSGRSATDAALVTHLLDELDRRDPERRAGVAAYLPLPTEPGGPDLPEAIAATGRPVWLPTVDAPGRPLRWVRWRGQELTRIGAFGIREPVPDNASEPVDTETLIGDLSSLVIPALAVGSDGVRLGQGGGFYDRTLGACASNPENHGKLMAIVDHEEFGLSVPATELDITVPVVVTDRGVFPTGPSGHNPHQ